MQKTNKELLKERIEQNYTDFKSATLILDEESIYDMAGRIAVVEEAYYQMTEHEHVDEDEAEFLLMFHNPLEMIADFLEEIVNDQLVEIDEALYELFEREDNEENYVTASLAEELKQKYGADADIKLALMSEAVEAAKQYLRLLRLIDDADDEGVDFCLSEE